MLCLVTNPENYHGFDPFDLSCSNNIKFDSCVNILSEEDRIIVGRIQIPPSTQVYFGSQK